MWTAQLCCIEEVTSVSVNKDAFIEVLKYRFRNFSLGIEF